jgi:DNA-binding transcriptional ArsR family regulator
VQAIEVLADGTRRRIVELLAVGDRTAGELAGEFTVSRPAVSRHLRVLRQAGLVRSRELGTQRLYSLEPAPLEELDVWLSRYRGFWTQRLEALEVQLRRARREEGQQ